MTRHKTFKRRVRARMARTGESYTAARRVLLAAGDRPDPPAHFEPPVSEEALIAATGKGWAGWLALLDEWGALTRAHGEIARWLVAEHGVSGWWSQTITVGFERARGLRAPGQRPDGWAIGATRTIAAPVEQLFAAFTEPALRGRWLPDVDLTPRTTTPPKSARFDWEGGPSRVVVLFERIDDGKSRIAMEHERLPDADTAEAMKAWWRERANALKSLLEGDQDGR